MVSKHSQGLQDLLRWNEEYSCLVALVDHQHMGILGFINDWYHQIIATKGNIPHLSQFMADKLAYLEKYSRSHLRFEEEMMELLVQEYGFSQEEHQKHLIVHQRFIKDFMGSVASQLGMLSPSMAKGMVDSLAGDTLSDLARWWFGHIKGPTAKLPAGPDHTYRNFLLGLPTDMSIDLLNNLLLRATQDLIC
jgi:hemerythrin-like metal-binding protein